MTGTRTLGLGDAEVFARAISQTPAAGLSVASGAADAFGRSRVSEPFTLFDSKQIVDNLPLFFDDAEVDGSGTQSTYFNDRASTVMSVSGSTAGRRVRQTFRRFNYQPGKSQLIFETFVLGAGGDGITKRVGYFDDNDGVFLEQADGLHYFVLRSSVSGSPVDTRVALEDGSFGKTALVDSLDFTKSQILVIDFEWLGVGQVRCGLVLSGAVEYIHAFDNANVVPSVYMKTPNLPIRYEIENDGDGAANTLEAICSTVISEGGLQQTGTTTGVSLGTSPRTLATTGAWYPLVSLRLKTGALGITIQPTEVSAVLVAAVVYEIALFINPTITGGAAAVWTGKTNSAIEYDITRDGVLTGGYATRVEVLSQERNASGALLAIDNILTVGSAIDGTRDELVFAARRLTGNSTDAYAALNWRELL